jgi:hypothetical protein
MEHPGMDLAGASLLAGYFHLVVRRRFGLLGFEYFGGYVARQLGSQLRQRKRPTKGE